MFRWPLVLQHATASSAGHLPSSANTGNGHILVLMLLVSTNRGDAGRLSFPTWLLQETLRAGLHKTT